MSHWSPPPLIRTLPHVTSAIDIIDAQNREIAELKKKIEAMNVAAGFLRAYQAAVHMHNLNCDAECNKGANCGYEGYLRRTGRRCAECPAKHKVDVMPHGGSS